MSRPSKQPRLEEESDAKDKDETETIEPEADNPVEGDVDTDSELTELDAEVILRDLGSRGNFLFIYRYFNPKSKLRLNRYCRSKMKKLLCSNNFYLLFFPRFIIWG